MLKICVALNKEKGIVSFRNPVTMRTIEAIDVFLSHRLISTTHLNIHTKHPC